MSPVRLWVPPCVVVPCGRLAAVCCVRVCAVRRVSTCVTAGRAGYVGVPCVGGSCVVVFYLPSALVRVFCGVVCAQRHAWRQQCWGREGYCTSSIARGLCQAVQCRGCAVCGVTRWRMSRLPSYAAMVSCVRLIKFPLFNVHPSRTQSALANSSNTAHGGTQTAVADRRKAGNHQNIAMCALLCTPQRDDLFAFTVENTDWWRECLGTQGRQC